MRVQEFCDIM